jgi:chromosomal replication initiator protein
MEEIITRGMCSPYAYPGVFRKEKLTLTALERLVCEELGVTPESLHVKCRRRDVCYPRQVFYHFAHKNRMRMHGGGCTIESIADFYGQSHATVIHAAQKVIPSLMATNKRDANMLANIAQKIDEVFALRRNTR